jgi:glycosyltransferase involved in cell wall biosynthesis
VLPAADEGVLEYLGELEPPDRDRLFAGAFVTLMLGSWPEPFGLVAIESLATGTPVIARRTGALPEIVEEGVDGYLVDDLGEAELALTRIGSLDRAEIRRRALSRFSVERMTSDYEDVYRKVIAASRGPRHEAARWTPASSNGTGRAARHQEANPTADSMSGG